MDNRYSLFVSEGATIDIEDIRDFNEGKKAGLGFDYLEDILDCLDSIQANPKSYQYYRTAEVGIRRGVSKRFSLIILYSINEQISRLEILTVADSRQDWF